MFRILRFITVLLVALSMSMAFCHALELIPKMRYDGPLYLTIQRSLYVLFGAPLGAAIEVGAVVSSVALVFLVRRRGRAFALTVAAAVCMVIAHAIWWIWVNPANIAFFRMAIQHPTPGWKQWRSQWEYAHLCRFVLQFVSFVALLLSLVLETSAGGIGTHPNGVECAERVNRTG